MKRRNFVHKHAWKYNKARTHRDRKKDEKRGYQKHKNPHPPGVSFFLKQWYFIPLLSQMKAQFKAKILESIL